MTDKEIFFEVLHKARKFRKLGDRYDIDRDRKMLIVQSYSLGYYEALHRRYDERS